MQYLSGETCSKMPITCSNEMKGNIKNGSCDDQGNVAGTSSELCLVSVVLNLQVLQQMTLWNIIKTQKRVLHLPWVRRSQVNSYYSANVFILFILRTKT